ncbi:MAG: AAA family ATPase [Alphaproteobacteria bacterium]|nr:AAA family ATPase [Alphaproteobacteria bacterium]
MAKLQPLPAEELYRTCDPDSLGCKHSGELEDLDGVLGQERAIRALRFGVDIRRKGYNLFAFGTAGIGRHTMVRVLLEQSAGSRETASDWCYVNNFADPQKPRALRLPPGRATPLSEAMQTMVRELRATLPAIFEGDDYRARREVIEEQFKQRNEQAFGEVERSARQQELALLRTPLGLTIVPTREGQVMSSEEFHKLPEEEQEALKHKLERLQRQLEAIVRKVPDWDRERREEVRKLNREMTKFAVGHLIDELREQYADLPDVLEYFADVEQDILENANDFLVGGERPPAGPPGRAMPDGVSDEMQYFRRYQVNVMVRNQAGSPAPVVYEDHPTHQNLIGRIEHMAHMGALVTDFNLVKPGALHKANGGYLVLDAGRLLMDGFAWATLKRALDAGEVRIESLERVLSLGATVSLEPQPIPLDVKVVLVGEPLLYLLLDAYDPDFRKLFKVAVDFDDRVPRDDDTAKLYARLIAAAVRREGLRPFGASAMARVIENASRIAGDSGKLSTHMRRLIDLLAESDHVAAQAGAAMVEEVHVSEAIALRVGRVDRMQRRIQEEIVRGAIRIETEGGVVGQVNGLSVYSQGEVMFGQPSRITARVRLGRGEVLDIEREVKLGGPLHSKGVLILSGFLGGRYARKQPLSLGASIVFEQSYGGVDGDSASSAELYALLSALADVPLRQSLAVTGSVDQLGRVQAIGGVNEKIEGFFDICKARGLTGEQGVLIPEPNARNLMLREDVVQAVRDGRFAIFPVATIDQGLELLTGLEAGEVDASGEWSSGSLNHRVAERVAELARAAATFARTDGERHDRRE